MPAPRNFNCTIAFGDTVADVKSFVLPGLYDPYELVKPTVVAMLDGSAYRRLQPFAIVTITLCRWERRWIFPERPWVEYGPKDEAWARKLGYGQELDVPIVDTIEGRLVSARLVGDPGMRPYLELTLTEPAVTSAIAHY